MTLQTSYINLKRDSCLNFHFLRSPISKTLPHGMSTVTYAEVMKRCKIIVLATPFMFLDTLPLDQTLVGTIVIDCSNRGQVCKEKEISQAEIIQVFLKAYNPPDLMAISETLTKLFVYFLYILTMDFNQRFGRLKFHLELMS